MKAETMIIEGVNCWKTRSVYYGMAILSSLGCLTATLVQLRSLPCWEDKDMVATLFIFAAQFLVYAILVVRSLCVPVPTITNETRPMGADRWLDIILCCMLVMFLQSYHVHSVQLSICMFGVVTACLAVKQLNWPVQDVYIQQVVFTDLLSCLSGYLGYQRPDWPAYYVFAALALLSCVVNHIILDQDQDPPFTDFVHSRSRFHALDIV